MFSRESLLLITAFRFYIFTCLEEKILRKTKIVCTLGPSTDNIETMRALAKAGMNVARMNFSHGSYEEHLGRLNMLRQEIGRAHV